MVAKQGGEGELRRVISYKLITDSYLSFENKHYPRVAV